MFKRFFDERNLSLIRELVITDFKLRYQGSVFGYLWSLAKPMMLFGVLYVVFVHFLRFGDAIPHYPTYLLLGIVLWTYFVESTVAGMHSIVDRGELIRKVSLPKYVIVLSTPLSALINLLLNLVVVGVFMAFNQVEVTGSMLLLPLVILELFILCLAASFLFSALFVKFRDIAHIWEVILQVLFYATPIIYPISFIPQEFIRKLLLLNPLAQIIQDARYLVITREAQTAWQILPPWAALIPYLSVAVLVALTSLYFRRNSKYFAENI